MAHDTTINAMSGGDSIVTYDLATGGAYPTAGKVPASVIYVGAAPAPLSTSNPLPTAAAGVTGALFSGTTSLTPKFAAITASASGSTNAVAAVTSKKIRVLRYALHINGAVNVKFVSNGGSPTDLTGLKYGASAGPLGGGAFCPLGLFETAAGEPLAVNLSGAVAVGGEITYVEV